MKKIICVLLCALLVGCGSKTTTTTTEISATMEPITYENSVQVEEKTVDMSGYQYLNDSNPAFTEISMVDSARIISEKGTGILYYGYSHCPYCNYVVPVLNKVAKDLGVNVYYINVMSVQEDTTMTDEEKVAKAQEDYNAVVPVLEETFDADDSGEKQFFVPEVVIVKDGEILDYNIGLLEECDVSSTEPLKDAGADTLIARFTEMIEKLR